MYTSAAKHFLQYVIALLSAFDFVSCGFVLLSTSVGVYLQEYDAMCSVYTVMSEFKSAVIMVKEAVSNLALAIFLCHSVLSHLYSVNTVSKVK